MTKEKSLKMFGVDSISDYMESVKSSMPYKAGGMEMVIVSLLSDAQEEIANGMAEEARQTINRVKFLVMNNGN